MRVRRYEIPIRFVKFPGGLGWPHFWEWVNPDCFPGYMRRGHDVVAEMRSLLGDSYRRTGK